MFLYLEVEDHAGKFMAIAKEIEVFFVNKAMDEEENSPEAVKEVRCTSFAVSFCPPCVAPAMCD